VITWAPIFLAALSIAVALVNADYMEG